MIARQSHRAGQLDREDVRMIEGVFEFTEKTARDVMTPRTDVVAFPSDLMVDDAARRAAEAGRSRYPIYAGSVDDVVGIVHVKQILATLTEGKRDTVRSVMRPPIFVPGSREVEDVLADLKRLKAQMAIVLDEYGGTAGIVTMEDLLEEIVGEIYDEYDVTAPQPTTAQDGVTLPGDMEIEDVNTRFGLKIADDLYQTIGGFVFGQLGRLPSTGDVVETEHAAFEVLAMDGRRVGKVKMVKKGAKKGEVAK